MQNRYFLLIFIFIIFFSRVSKSVEQKDIYNFSADKIIYSQDSNIIEAVGNVIARNQEGKQISSDRAVYNKNNLTITTIGKSKFIDNKNNILYSDNIEYDLDKKIIKAEKNVKFLDNYKNTYYFSKIISDDKFIEIIGYDLDSDLDRDQLKKTKDKFQQFTEPRLSGKEASIKENITIIKDAKFTSCKRSNENEECPYWNLNATQIIHDKDQKKIIYRGAVLDLNNIPVFYTPYFSHPDPSVKRESGFLAPSFTSLGENIGSTVKLPYFHAISESKDLTISPVYYFSQNPLLLGEYREKFKNGDLSIEAGFTEGYKEVNSKQTAGERHHLYGNLYLNYSDLLLDKSTLNAKVQRINNPTYLRVNKINSNNDGFKRILVKEDDIQLTNEIYLNSFSKNENLNIKSAVYQNISLSSDQYQYLLPEISYSKYGVFNNLINGLNFDTNLKAQNTNTNQNKSTLINNLSYNSPESYNTDLGIGYKFLTKINNLNYYSDYNAPKQSLNNEINPIIGFDTSLPFAKISNNSEQYLVPRIFTRYSPGQMNKSSSNDTTLTTDNLFSINRMNNDELIEKDLSFNLGLDWEWKEKDISNKTKQQSNISVGQVIKLNENLDMPTKSSLQNKTSDIVTKAGYYNPGNFNVTLKSTLDNQLTHMYYNDFTLQTFFKTNELNFNFYEKNSHVGNERYAKANLTSYLTNNTSLKVTSDRNLKTDRTNAHKAGIEYENECIRYGFYFQKSYFVDKDLTPNTAIFFGVTLLPFGDNYTTGNIIPSVSGRPLF